MRGPSHALGESGFLDQPGDVPRRPHDAALFGVDDDLRRTDASAHDRVGLELPSTDGDAAAELAHLVDVGTGVDEAGECHVAGDPREAVEPRDVGHVSVDRDRSCTVHSRNAAHAAPNPLSMPTTVTPAAHDASIASSAVMP